MDGTWTTNYGSLVLTWEAASQTVRGTYGTGTEPTGTVVGVRSGNTVAGRWEHTDDPASSWGAFVFVLHDDRFEGRWAYATRAAESERHGEWYGARGDSLPTRPAGGGDATELDGRWEDPDYGDLYFVSNPEAGTSFGVYPAGGLTLVFWEDSIGGIWGREAGSDRYGACAFERHAQALQGRWIDLAGGTANGPWNAARAVGAPELDSPYRGLAQGGSWVKGTLHNHGQQFTNAGSQFPSAGGALSHSNDGTAAVPELLQMLRDHGYGFAGIATHEVLPGTRTSGSNARWAKPLGTAPNGMTLLGVIENQVQGTKPSWSRPWDDAQEQQQVTDPPVADEWSPIPRAGTEQVHRLYVEQRRGFWWCHPGYYAGAPDVAGVRGAVNAGERLFGLEVYNRYGHDRNRAMVYADSAWDELLGEDGADGQPRRVWGTADDCGFLHDQARVTRANPPGRYGFDRGTLRAWLGQDPTPTQVIGAVEAGRFYSSSGILLRRVAALGDTLVVEATEPVHWTVKTGPNAGDVVPLNASLCPGGGQIATNTPVDAPAAGASQTLALRVSPGTRYVRVECRVVHSLTVGDRSDTWTFDVREPGDHTAYIPPGQVLEFAGLTYPYIVDRASYDESSQRTSVRVIDGTAANRTDARVNTSGPTTGAGFTIDRRAWLQPAWL
ncbi:MAG: hypothetical protein AAF682_16935 [Planctomycetota bacterium]